MPPVRGHNPSVIRLPDMSERLMAMVDIAGLARVGPHRPHSPFTIPSTIFFASLNSIMVLSRKNSSFSTPA